MSSGQPRATAIAANSVEHYEARATKASLPVPPGMGHDRGGHEVSRPWQSANMESFICHPNFAIGTATDFPASIPSVPRGIDTTSPTFSTNFVGPFCSTTSDNVPVYLSAPPESYFASNSPSGTGSLERRLRSQERNRIAAMKSRQRKKKEWERLMDSEAALARENTRLKEEVMRLRNEIQQLNGSRTLG